MRLSLLLTLLLVFAPAGTALAQTAAADAAKLADEGHEGEALAAFRLLAAQNPNDLEARLWIARLHERMGHPDQA